MVQRHDSIVDRHAKKAPTEKPSVEAIHANTKKQLEEMRKNMGFSELFQSLLADYNKLSSKERMSRIGEIIKLTAFGWLFKDKPEKKENKEKKKPKQNKQKEDKKVEAKKVTVAEDPNVQSKTAEAPVTIEKTGGVICRDMRLLCVNFDPVGRHCPAPKGKSSWFLKDGLPDYPTFRKEAITKLVPSAKTEEEGVTKATKMLMWAPMGKFQCMPRYLFPKINLPYQGEEGLQAMWTFLQSEKLQRAACRGYMAKLGTKNPRYMAAAYYGGADEIAKLRRYDSAKAKEVKSGKESLSEAEKKVIKRMEGKQGVYASIRGYANSVAGRYRRYNKTKAFNMEAFLDAIAMQESGYLEGKETPARRNTKQTNAVA